MCLLAHLVKGTRLGLREDKDDMGASTTAGLCHVFFLVYFSLTMCEAFKVKYGQ